MRSTRRSDRYVPWVATAVGLLLVTLAIRAIPPPPRAPRFLGAGSEAPRAGGTLTFYGTSNIRTFDPHSGYDVYSIMGIRLVFDGLVDYDHEGRVIPSLAEALPEITNDGKTFRFRLRRGVRFHNGRELVAEDVRWSMEHLLAPTTGSPAVPFYLAIVGAPAFHEGQAEHVEGIHVVDPYTIDFTLSEPDQTFLAAMGMTFAYPVPRENYARWGSRVGHHPVGTGPFVFDRWERGVQAEFVRYPHYFRPQARPDRMVFIEGLDLNTASARFRNGDIDALYSMSLPDYLFFKKSRAWAPYRAQFEAATIAGIGLNCEIPPFDNVHVRRAVAFALDREAWSRMNSGRTRPAGQILPPMIAGYDANLPSLQRFDLEVARREMALAGHPNGLPAPIEVMVGEGPGGLRQAQLIAQDLARIGIRVEPKPVAFATYLEQTGRPRTVQAFTTAWNMDFPDPANFLDILFHSRSIHPTNSENRAFYRNPELDRLLDAARAETDPDRRLALYRQANEIVARDAPWAFTTYPLDTELWQPYVRNYRPHPVWSQSFRDVWLDLPRRRAPLARLAPNASSALAAALAPLGGLR